MRKMSAYGGYEWLNNRVFEVGGQRFVGTPLWANFCHDPGFAVEIGREVRQVSHRSRVRPGR